MSHKLSTLISALVFGGRIPSIYTYAKEGRLFRKKCHNSCTASEYIFTVVLVRILLKKKLFIITILLLVFYSSFVDLKLTRLHFSVFVFLWKSNV